MKAFGFYFGQGSLDGIEVPQSHHLVPPRPVPHNLALHETKPLPPIGRANLQDPRNPLPVDYQSNGASQCTDETARQSVVDQNAYSYLVYNKPLSNIVTRSLGRSYMYAVKDAWVHSHGGLGYPADYGFGPGDHKDKMTPQFYMRPGVRPLRQASPIPNNAYKLPGR